MTISKCSDRKIRKTVSKMFGKEAPWDRRDSYVFVHLDKPDRETRKERVENFDPALFFDPTCPHCQPFFEDGAFMVHTPDEVFGMRMLENGMFETVMLTSQRAVAAS